ncbi:cytosine-specific methyltransferase [Aureimonas sp. SA4125]|uniref:DNA cytosine methyltransferase n=1 Tax=Aureimonas sp. SA4125 TaxID=2826993 RepID=UPI001CC35E49|nr:DNA cytosine methyltransferase [Aureimonas sp. SA4125]BDA85501.1 cytosine-specific methyltransferase [Aureimonas sp. SA4125]
MSVRLKTLSVCSGISAASFSWKEPAFEFVGFADIDPFSAEYLAQRKGCGRPRYMPDADEPEISAKEAKARRVAIKAVKHLPEISTAINFGDFSQISDADLRRLGPVDLLEGGTPCQAFSIAGLRAGLSDRRGGLMLEFIKLAKRMEKWNGLKYVVWENVPGVLSDAVAFGSFLGGLSGGTSDPLEPAGRSWSGCGVVYGPEASVAWRVLDAQFFGLAQRRARCFALGVLGGAPALDPLAVLAESEGVRRDSPPSRRAREVCANDTGERAAGDRRLMSANDPVAFAQNSRDELRLIGGDGELAGALAAQPGVKQQTYVTYGIADYSTVSEDVAPTLQSRMTAGGRMDAVAYPVTLTGHAEYVASNDSLPSLRASGGDCGGGSEALVVTTHCAERPVGTLLANGAGTARAAGQGNELDYLVVQSAGFSAGNSEKARGIGYIEEATPPLRAGASGTNQVPTVVAGLQHAVEAVRWIVRRLTPTECERLMGFEDGHTAIVIRGKPAADGPRYRALGNSMATPCMAFIGNRLHAAHSKVLAAANQNRVP